MQLKERVTAGLKIIGFYFFFVALEKVIALGLSLYFLGEDAKQGAASAGHLAITRQGVGYASGALFYLLAALVCIKLTPALVRICVGRDDKP